MKALYKIFAFIILVVFYSGCNSTIYEIIEVEEPVEIKPEKTEVPDIKEDITEEPKITDNKFTDKQLMTKTFAIQIGAFNSEVNATGFTDKAKKSLKGQDIYVKNIEGLYKVRLGNFNSKEEAISLLEKIQGSGFSDSFVVELTYYKVEK